jgi:hypothetical protein
MVYNDGSNRDAGMGYTYVTDYANALNIKNTLGDINFIQGSKNVCKMTSNGMANVVLQKGAAYVPNACATETTELGVKFMAHNANALAFEFRFNATKVKQFMLNATDGSTPLTRYTTDNGATWSAWSGMLDATNTAWV